MARDTGSVPGISGGQISGVFRNNGGVATQIGGTTQEFTAGAATATFGTSGGSVTVSCTAASNNLVLWTFYTEVSPSAA
jgi:hypothetical protein